MKVIFTTILAFTIFSSKLATPIALSDHTPSDDPFNFFNDKNMMIPASIRRRARRQVRFPAKITFSASGEAWLYINGVEKEHINNSNTVKQVMYTVMRGDVVSLKIRSNGPLRGVAVNVEYEGQDYPSSVDPRGPWKARKATGPYTFWMLNTYSSCTWLCPVAAAPAAQKAANFPYETGASYVWASPNGYGHSDLIWMRHVIGSESCLHRAHQSEPRKRLELCDLIVPACQHIWGLLAEKKKHTTLGTIAGSKDDYDECRCRPVVGSLSKCYRMYYKGRDLGLCLPYICGTKYECVKDGGDDLSKCVRRIMTSRVVPMPRYRRYCERVSIPPKTFYVLSSE